MRPTVSSSHPFVVWLALLLASCSGGREFQASDDGGAGGQTGSGGTAGHATGGAGGQSGQAGGHAGGPGTGGGAGTGLLGSGGKGGAGATGMGGGGGAATGTGGVKGTGGATGTGGVTGTGGATGTGGCNVACGGSGTCAGSCATGTCVFPTGNCGNGSTCSGTNIVGQSTCSNGACVTPAAKPCDGGLVCSGNACETACTTDADCLPSYFCEANSCHLDAVQVSCGAGFSCALLSDGSVRCWGSNRFGALGPGGPSPGSGSSNTPVTITGLGGKVTSISATGAAHACALLSNGGINCWGSAFDGELGNNSTLANEYSTTPLAVSGLPGTASAVSASSDEFSCALMSSNGTVWCWGINIWGNLGNGTSGGQSPTPVQASGLSGVTALAGGNDEMCAIASGEAYCWGEDDRDQVGNGVTVSSGVVATPTPVTGLGGGATFLTVAAGGFHGCGIVSGGAVVCWGWNPWGEIGSTVAIGGNALSATSVPGLPSGAKSVVAGQYHTCALLTNGAVWCWGEESSGQLGDGRFMESNGNGYLATPVQVGLPTGSQATAISAGAFQTCALLTDGSVWCWGEGDNGELGNGNSNSSTPLQVAGW